MKRILLSLTVLALAVPAMPATNAKRANQFGKLLAPTKINPSAKTSDAAADDRIITTPPAGKLMNLMGNSQSFYIYYDQVTEDETCGLAYEAVLTDDGDVYLRNPVSMLDWNNYIKGKMTDDGMVFDFPQPIYTSANGDETYTFQVDVLEYAEVQSPSNPNEYISTFAPAADTRSILFAADPDGYYRMQGDYMLGVTYEGIWQGYGEMQLELKPFDAIPYSIPEGIEYDYSYILSDELNGWDEPLLVPLGIGEKDGMTYIKGLASGMPDVVVVGSFDKETNKLSIPSDQFLGKYDNRYIFMMVGEGYSYYDEYWEEYMFTFDITHQPMVLNYDPDSMTFNPVVPEGNDYSYLIFNCGNEKAFPIEYYAVDRIYSQGVISDHTPLTPEVLGVSDISYIDPEYSYSFEFDIFDVNKEDQILLTGNLYYNIFINGQLCTFTSEEYPDLAQAGYQEITDIPVSLNVGNDIYASGSYHGIAFRRADIETIGVRAVYIDGDLRYESETVTVTNTGEPVGGNSIGSIPENDRNTTEYFDLTGRRVSGSTKSGIMLRRTVLNNGSAVVEKIMR